MTNTPAQDRRVADSIPTSWVDRAPVWLRPYLRLARYDRPVGFWLLALPCWIGLAAARTETGLGWIDAYYAGLFGVGAIAMRGAGCTFNDIVDKDLDAQVARTANRPLAAKTVTLKGAWLFLIAQSLVGLLVLIQLPVPAILTGLAALGLVGAYPFMKRITWWPQVWLGLTFNWGIPVTGAVAMGTPFSLEIALLYGAAVLWTIGYDTIYACQDIEDDALVGVKSSARAMGRHIRLGVSLCYAGCLALVAMSAIAAEARAYFAIGFALFAAHLFRQALQFNPADGAQCLQVFKSNRTAGLVLLASFVLGGL